MTEREWLECAEPEPMLRSLSRRPRRKAPGGPGLDPERFRVYAVACARRLTEHLSDRLRIVLDHLERYPQQGRPDTLSLAWQIGRQEGELLGARWAEAMARILQGQADYRRLVEIDRDRWACAAVGQAAMTKPYHAAKHQYAAARAAAYREVLDSYPPDQPIPRSAAERAWGRVSAAEQRAQTDLLRDIFGNPFRPVAFDPAWRTRTAVGLAKQMHDSRDFGAMPILADALQDAGCDSEEVLVHCRGSGPHVRGCWVVDAVLGKV